MQGRRQMVLGKLAEAYKKISSPYSLPAVAGEGRESNLYQKFRKLQIQMKLSTYIDLQFHLILL